MYNVLIACASEENARYLEETLSSTYRVQCCFAEADAVEILQTQKPEILVLELSTPEMVGLAVLSKTSYQPPVILALVRTLSLQTKCRALFLGVQAIVGLPAAPEQVLEHLKRMTAEFLEMPTAPRL